MVRNVRKIGLSLALAAAAVALAGAAFAQVVVQSGGLPPPGSNGQGEPQSANSLPQGCYAGTPVGQHRQALQNYWTGQDAAASASLAQGG